MGWKESVIYKFFKKRKEAIETWYYTRWKPFFDLYMRATAGGQAKEVLEELKSANKKKPIMDETLAHLARSNIYKEQDPQ